MSRSFIKKELLAQHRLEFIRNHLHFYTSQFNSDKLTCYTKVLKDKIKYELKNLRMSKRRRVNERNAYIKTTLNNIVQLQNQLNFILVDIGFSSNLIIYLDQLINEYENHCFRIFLYMCP